MAKRADSHAQPAVGKRAIYRCRVEQFTDRVAMLLMAGVCWRAVIRRALCREKTKGSTGGGTRSRERSFLASEGERHRRTEHGSVIDERNMGASSTNEACAAIWSRILTIARHLSKRNPLPIEQHPSLVELRKGTSGTPVVYFIGIGFAELHLAQSIYADNSIFAIEVPWPSAWHVAARKNNASALPAMEQLVAPYVSALSAHAGLSPCVLAGHSFSGLMAFEAAHQFNRSGGKVEMVMLLDSKAKYPPPTSGSVAKIKKRLEIVAQFACNNRTSFVFSYRRLFVPVDAR